MSGVLLRRRGVEAHETLFTVYASDQFSGGTSSDISGRTTDSGLGGSGKTWVKGTLGSRLITINGSGQAAAGSSGTTNIYAFDSGQGDVFAQITLPSTVVGTNQSVGLVIRQNSTLSTANGYMARCQNNGSGVFGLLLTKIVNNAESNIGATSHTWAAGDIIGIGANGSTITLVQNGVQIESITDTTFANTRTFVGLRFTTGTWTLDDLLVRSP